MGVPPWGRWLMVAALAAIAWLWVVGLVCFVNWMLEVVPWVG